MMTINVNEARRRFAEIIGRVERGEQVVINRRGKPVAKMSAADQGNRPRLPDLAEFRASMGKPPRKPKATIEKLRNQERY